MATTYGYGPGFRRHRRYRSACGVATVRTTYEEGTLIVDVIDAEKNELVWRAFNSMVYAARSSL